MKMALFHGVYRRPGPVDHQRNWQTCEALTSAPIEARPPRIGKLPPNASIYDVRLCYMGSAQPNRRLIAISYRRYQPIYYERKSIMTGRMLICLVFVAVVCVPRVLSAQEKKLERLRVGGGSASAAQMSIWFAKEGGYYEKQGLNVEVISIPGSSLAIQAMLSGELPIIQAGGAGPIQAALSGTDTVILATIVKKFNWWIYGQANVTRMEDLKGKIFGVTRFGTQSDLASRIALRKAGLDPDRDVTIVQTGGPSETVTAMAAGRVQAAAISPPATLQAKRLKLKGLMDLTTLDTEYHVNGVVTTRRYLKANEDIARRFLRAYIEGAVRGMKDKTFAMKSMGKYFRTDDKEVLDETYELSIRNGFNVPPYPAGISDLLQDLERTMPKAKSAKPEEFFDNHLVRELDQSGFVKVLMAGK
jgi:ABC-type nitrate/sulfonate/bicarbonate transport system substrate-binding protein